MNCIKNGGFDSNNGCKAKESWKEVKERCKNSLQSVFVSNVLCIFCLQMFKITFVVKNVTFSQFDKCCTKKEKKLWRYDRWWSHESLTSWSFGWNNGYFVCELTKLYILLSWLDGNIELTSVVQFKVHEDIGSQLHYLKQNSIKHLHLNLIFVCFKLVWVNYLSMCLHASRQGPEPACFTQPLTHKLWQLSLLTS